MKKLFTNRIWIQAAATLVSNPFLANFLQGSIYRGAGKAVCVPGLNCYSCPAAAGACPLGSLQSALTAGTFPAYVLGLLILTGVLLGRAVCGFLCPFGWLQEGLAKLGRRIRIRVPQRLDKGLRFVKYGVLVLLVIALPLLVRGEYGAGTPYFCKYLCPAGTLEAGIPLAIVDETLQASLGGLFVWKIGVAAVILAACVVIPRAFCRYLCPLGAIYALFNRVSLVRLQVKPDRCIGCGKCEAVCPMQVEVLRDINSAECIRCGKCMISCPTDAIRMAAGIETKTKEERT